MPSLIRNMEKLARVISYDGIQNKKTHPTDIDSVLEFRDQYLILFEIKEEGKDITRGQSILLTRLADAWNKTHPDGEAIIIYATHNPNHEVITMAECEVQKVYRNRGWYPIYDRPKPSVKEILNLYGQSKSIPELAF